MSKISLHIEKRGAEVAGSRDCGATRSRGYWTSRTPEPPTPRPPETSKPRSPAASKSNLKHNFE